MRKIISLFARNYEGDHLVRDEVVPGAEWVLAGEGRATQKFDGTACLIRDGWLWKRYDAKKGRVPPAGFEPAQPEPDPVTGHWPGWIRVASEDPADKYHLEAWHTKNTGDWRPGTYELCGPKVQGNRERFARHALVEHGKVWLAGCPRTFGALREYLRGLDIEGVVWHHEDGRMVKIKGKDFGLKRGGL